MGGTGSGRSAERGTVGGAFRLKLGDFLAALPLGRLKAGDVEFTATIARPGARLCRATAEIRADVSLTSSGGSLRLRYDARPYSPTDAAVPDVPVDQRIPIVRQAQHFGGAQFFLVCPFTARRAKSLFLPWGATRFGCREAYRLVYPSQRRGPPDRALAVSRKIRVALGGSPSVLDPFPERPHGMHRKRYDLLRARDAAAGRVSMAMIEGKLDRMSPGWRERSEASRD